MLPLTALYFPQTALNTLQVGQELIFFDKIFYYLAAENDDAGNTQSPGSAEICGGYPPVPFKEDLDRFRQLIKELKGNEEEFYSGQLSSFSSGHEKNRDELSVRSMIQSIAGKVPEASQKLREGKEDLYEKEDLWQARLLLKLAEILHQEELELQQELAAISAKELELFEVLKGEPEIPFSPSPFFQQETRPPIKQGMLIKAWGKLFLADSKRDNYSVLLSDQSDAVELLFDANETLTQKRPVCLFRIPLPVNIKKNLENFLQDRMAFRQHGQKTIANFGTLMAECLEKGVTAERVAKFGKLAEEWKGLLENFSFSNEQEPDSAGSPACPADCQLAVYLCDTSLTRLFGRICKKEIYSESAATTSLALVALKSVG